MLDNNGVEKNKAVRISIKYRLNFKCDIYIERLLIRVSNFRVKNVAE